MVAEQRYRFNIVNCEKANSQFNFGMQPLLYSVKEAKEGKPGWVRTGSRITYYKNNFIHVEANEEAKSTRKDHKSYYTLTFSIDFPHCGDTCYLAYHYPYTYSMLLVRISETMHVYQVISVNTLCLQSDLDMLERSVDHSVVFYRRRVLCSSLNENPCPVLTITSQQKATNRDEGTGCTATHTCTCTVHLKKCCNTLTYCVHTMYIVCH